MKLYYGEIDVSLLKTTRDDQWYETHHNGWIIVLNKLMASITKEGLRYPLCVLYTKGEYMVNCGMQRLEACKRLGWRNIPCVIAYPDGVEPLATFKPTDTGNHWPTGSKVIVQSNCFQVLVPDRKEWNPDENNFSPHS